MKYLMLFFCTLTFLVSCTDDQDGFVDQKVSANKADVCVVAISNGKIASIANPTEKDFALSFKDEKSFTEFKEKLNSLSSDEQALLVASYGVKNLHDLASEADSELEKMGNSVSSMSEFKKLYGQYIEKYKGVLVTDSLDKSDVSLYVPNGDSPESYIANEKGYYVVGNKVISYNLSKIKSARTNSLQTRAVEAGTNDVCFRPFSNKKIFFRTYLEQERVRVAMHAKKHMWYGWKNDPARNYFFDSFIQNVNYVSLNSKGQEVVSPRLPRYVFTNNVNNGFNIILAERVNRLQKVTGFFAVWCDYTAEHDASGNYEFEKSEGVMVPKCLESKAQKVNVDLN